MKTVQRVFVVMLAVLLVACGGGGSGVVTPLAPNTVSTDADLTFIAVPGDPNKVSPVPGERNIEAVAFRMSWKNQRSGISQLVFTSQSSSSLWATFKDFKLVNSLGNDVSYEVPYNISRDDARHEIIVDFPQYPWYPSDYDITPRTYSLLASLNPGATDGVTFAFKLSAVQMHNAGVTATGAVDGRSFNVKKVVGVELPAVTTTSPRYIVVDPSVVMGAVMQVGSFSATCPAESQWGCQMTEVSFYMNNMYYPTLNVNGNQVGQTINSTSNSSTSSVGYYLSPGQTVTFTVSANVYGGVQGYAWISIPDMSWVVGGQQVKVNPVIPTGQDACGYIISDWNGCKG